MAGALVDLGTLTKNGGGGGGLTTGYTRFSSMSLPGTQILELWITGSAAVASNMTALNIKIQVSRTGGATDAEWDDVPCESQVAPNLQTVQSIAVGALPWSGKFRVRCQRHNGQFYCAVAAQAVAGGGLVATDIVSVGATAIY